MSTLDTILSMEMEYFTTVNPPLSRAQFFADFVSRFGGTPLNRSPVHLVTGGRCSWERGQFELAHAECSNPRDAIAQIEAGHEMLRTVVAGMIERAGTAKPIFISRCNVDHATHATSGAHENYYSTVDVGTTARYLIGHLASRTVFVGAGGLDCPAAIPGFVLEPRASYIGRLTSPDSVRNRGLIHLKQEPLGSRGHRIHLICSAMTCSQKAAYVKLGSTALIIRAANAGWIDASKVELAVPLHAFQLFSRDPSTKTVALAKDGRNLRAVDLQRIYLDAIVSRLDSGDLPLWARDVCREWSSLLDGLDADPSSMWERIDWVLKKKIFDDFCTAKRGISLDLLTRQGVTAENRTVWDSLKELDTRFGDVSEDGIFNALDAKGVLNHRVVTDLEVRHAMENPPGGTRATLRGEALRKLRGVADVVADWHFVFSPSVGKFLDLSDVFQTTEKWLPMKEFMASAGPAVAAQLASSPPASSNAARPSQVRSASSYRAALMRGRSGQPGPSSTTQS